MLCKTFKNALFSLIYKKEKRKSNKQRYKDTNQRIQVRTHFDIAPFNRFSERRTR